jgi:hypothetical protein
MRRRGSRRVLALEELLDRAVEPATAGAEQAAKASRLLSVNLEAEVDDPVWLQVVAGP